MPLTAARIALPKSVAVATVSKAKDTSTIAQLSPSEPQLFLDKEYITFDGAAEAEVVDEGAVKGSYEQELGSVTAKRVKLVVTTRVTNELQWADADAKLQIVDRIQDNQAEALGRALDYVVYHAINPKTKAALTGYTKLSDTATQVTYDSKSDVPTNLDSLADAVNSVYDINGIALSRKFASDIRRVRIPSTMARLYPEVPMNLQAGSLDGIKASVSGTVNGALAKADTHVLAFCGDFSTIKWGIVRDMMAEIIEYGDPDQTGSDLKAHNQVAYRTEMMLAYAVINPKAIAVLKTPTASTVPSA